MSLMSDMMRDYPPCLAAAKKIEDIADGFEFFEFHWLGDKPGEWTVMKVTGAIFREAKSGPRKGQRCIMVKGAERTVYVTSDEIEQHRHNAA